MNPTRLLAALGIAAALAQPSGAQEATAPAGAPPDVARGQELFALCAHCHGDAAAGNHAIGAPAIAGLPAWYVRNQLEKFSNGLRGKHFDDIEGLRMRPMTLWLVGHPDNPELGKANIASVAAYVATLPPTKPAASVADGDVARGEASWPLCGSCHGMQGEGSEPQSAPPLAGQSDWYVLASLQKFKAGTRGYDGANDPFGGTMRGMANVLADEQAMKDVVAYIATLNR